MSLLYVGYQIRESAELARLASIRSMDQGYLERAMNYVMVAGGIYTLKFVTWLEEQLQRSPLY